MKRFGKKIDWNAKAVLSIGAVLVVILLLGQVPNFVWVWAWGPSTGYRSAGFDNGHYERRFPAIKAGMPMIGQVLMSGRERLILDYELTIDEGKATLRVWKWPIFANRPRDIGPRLIDSSEAGRIEFAPGEPGLYRIFMHAYRLQGAVAINWRTVDGGPGGGREG